MLYKNVLVPYDKSTHATRALETALQLVSDDPEAVISVLYVAEAPETHDHDAAFSVAARMAGVQSIDTSGEVEMEQVFRKRRKEEVHAKIDALIADCPNEVHVKIATGRPHHAILNYADDHECDAIIMGCRGLNALQGMIGSVSYAVLRSSAVPVLIVK